MKSKKQRLLIILSLFFCFHAVLDAQSYNANINAVVQQMKVDSIKKTIDTLQGYQSRFLLNQNRLEIARFLQSKFISYGYEDTRIDTFLCHIVHRSGLDTIVKQYNVVATLNSHLSNDEVIVYGAHYDSFSANSDPLLTAPGADDNASGTAAVLETARVIKSSDYFNIQKIEFVLFAAEEYMASSDFSGSRYHANQAESENQNIVLMVNNDMISYNDGNNTICFSNYPSCSFATNLAISACENYSSLSYQLWPSTWPPFADAEPFADLGAQTVYFEESYFNPDYHSDNDIAENIDFNYATEVAKISCATILSYALVDDVSQIRYNQVKLYPNPTTDFINISLSGNERINNVNIYDFTGKKLIYAENSKVNVSNLPGGIYLIAVQTSDNRYVSKFVKK